MAHFARLDQNNMVIAVHVVNNNELLVDGQESEEKGIEFLRTLHGQDSQWKQTSYNGNLRNNYAGIGYTFNADIDAFVPPKPYASWILNNDTAQWEAPVAMPDDGGLYAWNEDEQSWDSMTPLSGNAD